MPIATPVSAKIRVAACHVDFRVRDLVAVEDEELLGKIRAVERILEEAKGRPHLLVFPECCACDHLIERARSWAGRWQLTTVCGTRLHKPTRTVRAVVVGPTGETEFEKKHLSPYDKDYSSITPRQGSTAGGVFTVSIIDQKQQPFDVRVALLVCYDFRYEHMKVVDPELNPDPPQIFLVPMFDLRFKEAQDIAGTLAKRFDMRTILASKACAHVDFSPAKPVPRAVWLAAQVGRRPWLKRIVSHLPGMKGSFVLPSSAHGPITASDARYLKDRRFDFSAHDHRAWRRWHESLLLADYEVGVPVSSGHDNANNVGWTYSNFESYPLRPLAEVRSSDETS